MSKRSLSSQLSELLKLHIKLRQSLYSMFNISMWSTILPSNFQWLFLQQCFIRSYLFLWVLLFIFNLISNHQLTWGNFWVKYVYVVQISQQFPLFRYGSHCWAHNIQLLEPDLFLSTFSNKSKLRSAISEDQLSAFFAKWAASTTCCTSFA